MNVAPGDVVQVQRTVLFNWRPRAGAFAFPRISELGPGDLVEVAAAEDGGGATVWYESLLGERTRVSLRPEEFSKSTLTPNQPCKSSSSSPQA